MSLAMAMFLDRGRWLLFRNVVIDGGATGRISMEMAVWGADHIVWKLFKPAFELCLFDSHDLSSTESTKPRVAGSAATCSCGSMLSLCAREGTNHMLRSTWCELIPRNGIYEVESLLEQKSVVLSFR
jgi:hypothetical protein